MAKTLLVYYSRTGTTRKVAQRVAALLDCDVEEIEDTVGRRGIIGYLRSGYQAGKGKLTRLKPLTKDPADYDLVILGTPYWTTVSVPVRTYMTDRLGRFRRVAFLITRDGSGIEKGLHEMTELAGSAPVAVLELAKRDFQSGDDTRKIEEFALAVQTALARA